MTPEADVSESRHKKRDVANNLFATYRGLRRLKSAKSVKSCLKTGLHRLVQAIWSAPLKVPDERLKDRFWPRFDISTPALSPTRNSPKQPDIAQEPVPVLVRFVMRFWSSLRIPACILAYAEIDPVHFESCPATPSDALLRAFAASAGTFHLVSRFLLTVEAASSWCVLASRSRTLSNSSRGAWLFQSRLISSGI
jgi:hypothetical protein